MDDTDRPLSVKEISDQALDFTFNPLLPIKSWLRTAQMLYREVRGCPVAPGHQCDIPAPLRFVVSLS